MPFATGNLLVLNAKCNHSSGSGTFVNFLRNLMPCVYYLGFPQTREAWMNKRILGTEGRLSDPIQIPPYVRSGTPAAGQGRVADSGSRWLCGLRRHHYPTLHSPSLRFLIQKMMILISHKTQSHFRGLKGKTKSRCTLHRPSLLDGTMSHIIPALSFHCTRPWDTTF